MSGYHSWLEPEQVAETCRLEVLENGFFPELSWVVFSGIVKTEELAKHIRLHAPHVCAFRGMRTYDYDYFEAFLPNGMIRVYGIPGEIAKEEFVLACCAKMGENARDL